MANYLISRRIQKIIQYINDKVYPSKEQILLFLESNDLNVSMRTFERDLKNIRTDFGIEITYEKSHNGYFIDEEESTDIESFFKFLELVTLTEVFSDGLQADKKLLQYVKFDDSSNLKGVENLEPILIAIKQGCKLSFKHFHYYKETTTDYTISPLMVKEYVNRWYVIGVPEGQNEIRTYGIDRLSEITKGELISIDKEDFQDQLNQFDNIVGVSLKGSKIEKIILKTHDRNMRYLRSLPLHHSQSIVPDKEPGYYQVMFHIIPNYEFDVQILKMSMEVEVIKPQWYREHIKNEIQKIYTKYQD